MRYCAGRGRKKLELVGYSDSDMIGDVDDRKSTSRMINFLSGRAICWQSTKQKEVAFFFLRSRVHCRFDDGHTGGLACTTNGGADRKRRRSTNVVCGQQVYNLPDKKSSFARVEQAYRDQVPLHPRMCRSVAYQD